MITKDELTKLSQIIKLELTDDEFPRYLDALNELALFAKEIDASGAEPCELDNISGLVNELRDDEIIPSFDRELLLEASGGGSDGFFYVPKHKLQ